MTIEMLKVIIIINMQLLVKLAIQQKLKIA